MNIELTTTSKVYFIAAVDGKEESPEETMNDFKITQNNLAQILQRGRVTQTVSNH